MIDVCRRMIVVNIGFPHIVLFNPIIRKKVSAFETEEGCLSLTGVRKCTRYQNVEVEYQDMDFKKQRRKFSGWTALIMKDLLKLWRK